MQRSARRELLRSALERDDGQVSPASAVVDREIEPHSRLTSDESLLRGAVGVAGARLGVMEAHGTGQLGAWAVSRKSATLKRLKTAYP